MGNISSGMESICNDIVAGHEDRKKSLHDVKKAVLALRDDARKFVARSRKLHQEMAKSLNETLTKDREDLTKEVDSLRKDFRKSQKEVRADLAQSSKAWSEMRKTLEVRKK